LIEKIGVIGAGAMGSSIAELFAYNGYSVYIKDQNSDYVNRGIGHARKVLEDFQGYVNSLPEKEIKRIERNGIELTEQQKNTIEKNLAK
jgi:3-hydroxybutyryl-CoA dehydrogenase